MRERLLAALAQKGLPPLAAPDAELRPFSLTRRFANHRIRLADGSDRLLRVARTPRAQEGLQHELAAFTLLQTTRLPVVSEYWAVDEERPLATLSSWMPGMSGRGVVDANPEALPQMCQQLGQLRRALEEQTTAPFAMGVVDGRFRAIRPTWREEYLARAWDWYATAERCGATLGPLSKAVIDRIVELSPSLDGPMAPVLVHGDLRPSNLMFEVGAPPAKDKPPPVAVIGVVDWELSVVGDPLLAFALPLELPDEALAWVLQGYGQPTARAWLDDTAALDRLTIYALGRVLQYLAVVVRAQIEDQGDRVGLGLIHAAGLANDRLRPEWVHARLTAALPEHPPVEVPLPPPLDRVGGVIRSAFDRLSGRPALGPKAIEVWAGAVGCALRDRAHEAEGWVRDGEAMLAALEPAAEPRGYEPIADRNAWAASLDGRIRGRDVGGMAVAVWWLALEALEQLGSGADRWPVSDDALRGLESLLHGLRGRPAATDSRGQMLQVTLALAAEHRLPSLLREEPQAGSARVAELSARLLESWEDLTVFGGETPAELDADAFRERTPSVESWAVPLVLLATEAVSDAGSGLPVPRRSLIGALCGAHSPSAGTP